MLYSNLDQPSESLKYAKSIVSVQPAKAEHFVSAVETLAECVGVFQDNEQSSEDYQPLINLAIEMMQTAKQMGFNDYEQLENNTKFKPILQDDRFLVLLN